MNDHGFLPSRIARANHFLCGDFVEYYEAPETTRDLDVPLGTPV